MSRHHNLHCMYLLRCEVLYCILYRCILFVTLYNADDVSHYGNHLIIICYLCVLHILLQCPYSLKYLAVTILHKQLVQCSQNYNSFRTVIFNVVIK